MEISYRLAQQQDIQTLTRLRIDYLMVDHPDITDDEISTIMNALPEYFTKHLNKDLFAFIAEDMTYRGEAVASAFLLVTEKPANPNFIKGRVGEVLNVITKPDYRRQGISTKLMEILLEEGKNQDLDFIRLSATDMGRDLYTKLGFEESASSYHEMKYRF